jgi:hypothetical protein
VSVLRTLTTALSAARAAFGVAMVAAPERIGEAWIGEPGRYERVGVLTRSLGARDVVLGGGAALALIREDGSARAWLGAQALADVVDLAGTLAVRDRLPQGGFRATVALAGVSAVLTGASAALLD